MKTCPRCGSAYVKCPECQKLFRHGTASRCDEPGCIAMNAPLDCKCGYVVADNLQGVLDFNLKLIPYK